MLTSNVRSPGSVLQRFGSVSSAVSFSPRIVCVVLLWRVQESLTVTEPEYTILESGYAWLSIRMVVFGDKTGAFLN